MKKPTEREIDITNSPQGQELMDRTTKAAEGWIKYVYQPKSPNPYISKLLLMAFAAGGMWAKDEKRFLEDFGIKLIDPKKQ